MSATIGAAAITAGAGLLGSLFGANKQDKNAQAQRDWQEKMYLMDREYNTAAYQRKRFEEAGLNPNLMINGSFCNCPIKEKPLFIRSYFNFVFNRFI